MLYRCQLPLYGTSPIVRDVEAPNKRAAIRAARDAEDRRERNLRPYWSGITPLHHWSAVALKP